VALLMLQFPLLVGLFYWQGRYRPTQIAMIDLTLILLFIKSER
jgi:hypothetical protein